MNQAGIKKGKQKFYCFLLNNECKNQKISLLNMFIEILLSVVFNIVNIYSLFFHFSQISALAGKDDQDKLKDG